MAFGAVSVVCWAGLRPEKNGYSPDGGNYTIGEMAIMKIDWKQKLTSRKFWAAVVGFVTTILVALKIPDMEIEQAVAMITAAGTLIAYIVGEGMVDAARLKKENHHD